MSDILIIGAGISGIYSLHHLRKRFPSWKIKVLEAGPDVGGVWLFNSYPGCRVDTETLSYCYSFDKELLEEWTWKEAFASQGDILAYLKRVAQKHDLYKDIHLNTHVKSARWDDHSRTWTFTDDSGTTHQTRFFVSCLGFLSAPTLPNIPGLSSFAGESFHTSSWPKDLDPTSAFADKRIGVIGTGATGIQTITELSKNPSIRSLHVFQRTANWSAPLHNRPIPAAQMDHYRTHHAETFARCLQTPSCFLHGPDPRLSLSVSPADRTALWEELYAGGGFSKWYGVFADTYTSREANALYSDFMAGKIRARVRDPKVAESLIPKDHGFGSRRVPLESGYFEAFNRENVHLVDLRETPLEGGTERGLRLRGGGEVELDVMIFATGFDAITGSFAGIEWCAKGGKGLTPRGEKGGEGVIWEGLRPRTFLGVMAPAMPNMFMVLGPHQPFGNATRSVEHVVGVIADLIGFCQEKGYACVEPKEEAVEAWTEHVMECSKAGVLINEVDSWMTGVNRNVEGKMVRNVVRYSGSAIEYRRRCAGCKESGYEGLEFT